MAKRWQIDLEKPIDIWTLHNLGFSNREIGLRLNISESRETSFYYEKRG